MNAKNILKISSLFLNLSDEFEAFIEKTAEPNAENEKEFNTLLKCLNLVLDELASDYLPILHKQQVFVENNKIYLDDLQKSLKEVFAVRIPSNLKKVEFKQFPGFIEVKGNGFLEIIYSINPDYLEIDSEADYFNGRVSDKCFALGVASEYSFINGFYEEAEIWDKRFKDSLINACRKKSEISLPKRRWL